MLRAEDTQCRAPDQTPVKATRTAGGRSRPTLTGAGGAHAFTRRLQRATTLSTHQSAWLVVSGTAAKR